MEKPVKVLIVDDDKDILSLLSIKLKKEGFSVMTENSPIKALEIFSLENFDVVLLDQRMPEMEGIEFLDYIKDSNRDIPVIIMTAFAEIKDAVEAIKKGAYHFITKPIDFEELKVILHQALNFSLLKKEVKELKEIINTDIIAESKQMKSIIQQVNRIAPFDINVLITGESGTGKEVLSKYIHKNSKRKNKPFIAINCGAIPHDLLESELFGYSKGAFTGAYSDKKGIIEEANGGTLFLDEIGELPLDLQVKLLRVLQENEIKPIGSNKPKKINVRFIAATNKNLERLIKEGKFREDLFYRLNVISIKIPPLRQRKEDIIPLAKFFLKKYSLKYEIPEKKLSEKAIQQLLDYNWKGNIRELEHAIERTILVTNGYIINKIEGIPVSKSYIKIKPFKEAKEEFERNYLENLLKETGWNISKASKLSKKTRAEIYRLMKKYHISN
jgi:two-component system response regulator GlrR